MLSSNSSSDQSGSTVNNKLLAVNVDRYPFEQTYDQNDLNINWNPDTQRYTGFLPVTVKATGVPSYTSFYADVDGQLFEQPIQYNGKYKFILKDDGPFATGLMPQYMQDQTSNSYDIYINIPNGGESITPNTATLTIDDSVLNVIRTNPLYNGILTLPDRDLNTLTLFNTNGKNYATALEIDLSNVTLPNMKRGTVITKNAIYDVVNNDGNNDDIEFEEQNTPTPTPHLLIKKRDPLLRDDPMEDDSEVNLGSFTVNIPPPKINSPTTNNGFYKFNDNWNALTEGSSEDHDLIIQVPNTTETLTATQNNHTYTPTQGNVGFSSVTVEVPQPSVESTKTVTITENTTTTITPSSNYDSIGQLEIITNIPSDVNNQTLTTITSNGTYTPNANYSGFNSFTVSVPQPSIQSNKQITLTNNSTVTINPDTNYDALGQITITTDVPTTDTVINNQNVNSNNLITSNGFYAPDSQYTGFNAFTVAIPLQKDKNINVNGKIGQTIVWTPDAGYAGFEQTRITVIPPAYQTKTITSNGTYTPDSNFDGFSSVTVNVSGTSKFKVKAISAEIGCQLSNFSLADLLTEEEYNSGSYNGSYIGISSAEVMGSVTSYNIKYFTVEQFYDLRYGPQWYHKIPTPYEGYTQMHLIDNNNDVIASSNSNADLWQFQASFFDFSDLPNAYPDDDPDDPSGEGEGGDEPEPSTPIAGYVSYDDMIIGLGDASPVDDLPLTNQDTFFIYNGITQQYCYIKPDISDYDFGSALPTSDFNNSHWYQIMLNGSTTINLQYLDDQYQTINTINVQNVSSLELNEITFYTLPSQYKFPLN